MTDMMAEMYRDRCASQEQELQAYRQLVARLTAQVTLRISKMDHKKRIDSVERSLQEFYASQGWEWKGQSKL